MSSAVVAPGIAPALAPPAAESPPPSSSSNGASKHGKSFADTVAAHRARDAANDAAAEAPEAAAEQAASGPNAPPGEPTADTTIPTDTASVLVMVQDLIRGTSTAEAIGTDEDTAPLLDRPAGAGDAETDVSAMEALMAQMLTVRIPAPAEDVTTAPVALVVPGVEASGSNPASALDALHSVATDFAALGAAQSDGLVEVTPSIEAHEAADAAMFADTLDGQLDIAVAMPGETVVPANVVPTPQAVAAAATASVEVVTEDIEQPALDATESDAVESSLSMAMTDEAATATDASISTGDRPSSGEGDAAEPRLTRVEATATNVVPTSVPTVQGESLAPTASTTRTEVAAGGGAVTSQIADTVQSAVLRGENELRLVLNPPELGRVEINITESTGGIRVHMLADQPGARELIERQLPMLQQALAAREVRVDRLEVGRAGDTATPQEWSSSQGSNDGQRQRSGQQDGSQWNGAPDWSPLASMGLGVTDRARAERPGAASTGGLDVMA